MASRRILNYGGGTRCGKMSALSYRALFKHWHSLSVLKIIPNIYANSSFFDFCFGKVLPLFNGANHKVRRVFNCCRYLITGTNHDFRRMFNGSNHKVRRVFIGANHDFRCMLNCYRHMITGASHDFRCMLNCCRHMISGANHKYTHPFLFPLSLFGGSL